jgi:hypothetical protein
MPTCGLSCRNCWLAHSASSPPVLLNLHLGIELAERIIEDKPGTKVLVISGYPDREIEAAEKRLQLQKFWDRRFWRNLAHEYQFESDNRMNATPRLIMNTRRSNAGLHGCSVMDFRSSTGSMFWSSDLSLP